MIFFKFYYYTKKNVMEAYKIAKEKGFSENDLEDVLIVENIKNGLTSEQGKLYSKYYKVILSKTKRYTNGDIELAEDWASEIMTKIFSNLDKYSVEGGSGVFVAWINKTIKNSILDKIRKENKKQKLISIDEQTDTEKSKKSFVQVKEESLNAEESLILIELSFELQAKLKIALEKISEEEKELINLRFYQGLSFEEIAQELNKTQNYCLVKFHRLKDKLKKMMK